MSRNRRHALVIGNERYVNLAWLRTAVGDARALGAALARLDFEVSCEENLDVEAFAVAVDGLVERVGHKDEVIVHFSGHGVSADGLNYLLPIGMEREPDAAQVRRLAVEVGALVDGIMAKGPAYVFVIIDACRDNPFQFSLTRSTGPTPSIGLPRGLCKPALPPDVFILYSASPGAAALDRLGDEDSCETSVFTRVLLKHIEKPGATFQQIAKETQIEVSALAGSIGLTQIPEISDRSPGASQFTAVAANPVVAGIASPFVRPPSAGSRPNAGLGPFLQSLLAPLPQSRTGDTHGTGPEPLNGLVPAGSISGAGTIESTHGIAVSPGGNRIASASSDGLVRIWEAGTGRLGHAIKRHVGLVRSVALSLDGRLASAGQDGTVHLWSAETGKHDATLGPHHGLVRAIAFAPDSRTLAAIDLGRGPRIWDIEEKTWRDGSIDGSGQVQAIAFSADGRLFASADEEGITTVLDRETGAVRYRVRIPPDCATALAFSPDGGTLACGTDAGQVFLVKPGSDPSHVALGSHPGLVVALAFTADGEALASAGEDGTVTLWRTASQTPLWSFSDPGRFVFSLAFCARENLIATGTRGNEIRFHDAQSGRLRGRLVALPEGEWAAIHGQGYSASPGAHDHLRLADGEREYPVDEAFRRRWSTA